MLQDYARVHLPPVHMKFYPNDLYNVHHESDNVANPVGTKTRSYLARIDFFLHNLWGKKEYCI